MYLRFCLLTLCLLGWGGAIVSSRAVNISHTWVLPQEGFPVFYRYFRDRITWYEADAVCQFHHGNLVTVDTSEQYDTTRAFLKELDVLDNVWLGLKRSADNEQFLWTDMKPVQEGYFLESPPISGSPICVATDPSHDFRWRSFNCGGPTVASFICELEVPSWAQKEDGCMITSLPSLTITYLPELVAVELISDCGLDGTRRIACRGQANREEMIRQLTCDEKGVTTSTQLFSSNEPSQEWTRDTEIPTRHRRDADSVTSLIPENAETTTAITSTPEHSAEAIHESKVPTPVYTPETTQSSPHSLIASTSSSNDSDQPPIIVALNGYSFDSETRLPETARDTSTQFPVITGSTLTTAHPETTEVTEVLTTKIALKDNIEKKMLQEDVEIFNKIDENAGKSMKLEQKHEQLTTEHDITSTMQTTTGVYEAKEDNDTTTVSSTPLVTTLLNSFTDKQFVETSQINETTVYKDHSVNTVTPTTVAELLSKTTQNNNGHSTERAPSTDETIKLESKTAELADISENNEKQPLATPNDPNDEDIQNTTMSDIDAPEQEYQEVIETEPEVPARPNRGRRLVRQRSRSFYPYFLNRVLG